MSSNQSNKSHKSSEMRSENETPDSKTPYTPEIDLDPIGFLEKVIETDELELEAEKTIAEEIGSPKKFSAIYLLPNLVTTAALLSGFYGVLAAMNEQFEKAAICIFVAMLLDGLDGRIARLTNTQSAFGEQYDSLADMVSFGVAPALIIYHWSLYSAEDVSSLLSKLAWMIPFLYCACAALRLARFNIEVGQIDSRYFIGLPSPSAAATVVGFVWFGVWHDISGKNVLYLSLLITLFAGVMMILPVKYYSFKKVNLDRKISLLLMALIVFVLAMITVYQPILWLLFFAYALHGPFLSYGKKRPKSTSSNQDL